MEVLRPALFSYGTYSYRINPGDLNNSFSEPEPAEQVQQSAIFEESLDDVDPRVKADKTGFIAQLRIPAALFKFIIGSKGDTKRRLQHETRCDIRIPPRGQEGAIVIKGATAQAVSSALTRIEVLSETSRFKLPFTHFVSIPFNSTQVQDGFTKFQQQVLDRFSGDPGVDNSLFQKPSKLHLTVCTLTLLNEVDVNNACEILHSGKQDLLDETPDANAFVAKEKISRLKALAYVYVTLLGNNQTLKLTGLDYMNDDPSSVDVLYAKVESPDDNPSRLQQAADKIVNLFRPSGLMCSDLHKDHVKLHVTVMNTLFRDDPSGTDVAKTFKGKKCRQTFYARNILKDFHKYEFGCMKFPGCHLSTRHSTDCSGYYKPVTMVMASDDPTERTCSN